MKLHQYSINKIYQLIAIAKNQLGMTDENHQALLESFGATQKNGRISATTLSKNKLVDVLECYIDRGFILRATPQNTQQREQGYTKKYRYILYILRQIDKDVSYADAMAKRMFNVDKALWLSNYDQSLIIKGLRKYAEKHKVKL